jgi:hypothetical protein
MGSGLSPRGGAAWSRKALLALALVSLAPRVDGQSSGLPFGLIVSEQSRSWCRVVGGGARAAGMGGAFTALADDATAASFNPAGLAQLLVPEASVVADFSRHRDEYRNFHSYDQVPSLDLTDSAVQFDAAAFNFASVTVPFELFSRRFAFQLSTQRLVDFTYEGTREVVELDPAGAPFARLGLSSVQSGSIRLYSGSLAFQPTERTLVGATVNRWDGRWEMASTNTEQSVVPGSEKEMFTYSQTNRLTGWNVDLGLLLRYPAFNVGVRYRTPFDADYDFSASLETNMETPLRPLPATTTTLHWPGTLNVGVAIKPADTLVLAADWGRTAWSEMNFDVRDVGHANFFDLEPPETTTAGASDDWHAGAELLLFLGKSVVPVRAGWFREPQPGRDAVTGNRIVRTGFSFGTGVKSGWLAIDASLRYSAASAQVSRFIEAEELASGVLRATSRGELSRKDWLAFVSLIIQIPSGSPPARALREIFVGPAKPEP